MKYLIRHFIHLCVAAIFCLVIVGSANAQTDMDAIMMNKNQFCNGFVYDYSSWDHYWEGKLNRINENIGTASTQAVMFMSNYGITNNLNVMASVPYVWTKVTGGTLHGMKGIQDLTLFVKWRPVTYSINKNNKISLFVLGGISTPASDYVIDFLPMSIGLGSTNVISRGMIDYKWKRFTVTGSAAFIWRSNIKTNRTSYYDTELHITNEVKMPNAAQYQLRTGYRGKYIMAEALLTNWTTLGGFDITRNNMPFMSNRMNATMVGFAAKYTFKKFTNLSVTAGGNCTIAGRNMGQAKAFNVGAFYAFYFKKKAKH
jgi:hypothetical protein